MNNKYWILKSTKLIAGVASLLIILVPPVLAEDGQDDSVAASRDKALLIIGGDAAHYKEVTTQLRDAKSQVMASYVLTVDPSNKEWNPNNPKWQQMEVYITHDMGPHYDDIIGEIGNNLIQLAIDSYINSLTESDANELIAFYKTNDGKRFKKFEDGLQAIYLAANLKINDVRSGKIKIDLTSQTPEVMKSRIELITHSRSMQAQIKRNSNGSGEFAVGIIAQFIATIGGEDIDHLSKKYAKDIPEFEKISELPLQQKASYAEFLIEKGSTEVIVNASEDLKFFQKTHIDEWRDFYQKIAN
ncbi:MAG TPA: DUF2059 domain-containing protein [Methylophilaceae bacterium]|jgi:hypothetical protein